MTDSADPRIALMQKWSAENPELLAQAGLSASAVDALSGGNDHFVAMGLNPKRIEFLKLAGLDPAKHAHPHSGNPHTGHTEKKGKGKKNQAAATYTQAELNGVVKAVKSGAITTHNANNTKTKPKHHNPYNDVDHEKLKSVFSQAWRSYQDSVKENIDEFHKLISKAPIQIKSYMSSAFDKIKEYQTGMRGSPNYDTVLSKLKETLSQYKAKNSNGINLKHEIKQPHSTPDNTADGVTSLLSKLINMTMAFIKTHYKEQKERETYGYYELRQESYKLGNSKKNCIEIKQALAHQKEKHEAFLKNTTRTGIIRPGSNGGAVVRESAEHAFEKHGTFSMGSPYDT